MAINSKLTFGLFARDEASPVFDKFGNKVAQTEKRTSLAGAGLKKLAVGFAALGAGTAAVGFLKSAVGEASNLNETVSKSNAIFGKQQAGMNRWAKTAATSMGMSRSAALESAAGFGDMFKQLGFTGGAAAKMSRKVVSLSADLGSFNNLPTAEVTDMMAGAFRGEYDSLQRVIPNINAARVQQEAMNMTGKKSASLLTAQEKAAATLAIVQRDGARANGDFARTSGGLANQQKILGAQMDDLKAKVGAKLLPVMVFFARFLNDKVLPALSNMGPVIKQVATFVGNLFSSFKGTGDASSGMGQLVATIQSAWASIKSIFQSAVLIVTTLWHLFGNDIMTFIRSTFAAVMQIVRGAFTVIQGIFNVIAGILTGDWSRVWTGIKQILSGALTVMLGLFNMAKSRFILVFSLLGKVLGILMRAIWHGLVALVKAGAGAIVSGVKAIPGMLGKLAGKFGSAGKSLIQAFVNGMKNAGGVIKGIAGNVWTAVRKLLNGAISKINAALAFTIHLPLGKSLKINPPDIPKLAKGGVVTRPTVALIGEAGPEAVIPLGRGGGMRDNITKLPDGGRDSRTPIMMEGGTLFGWLIEKAGEVARIEIAKNETAQAQAGMGL